VNSKLLALTFLTLTLVAQRRVGQSNITVPVPSDPHELVNGPVQAPVAGESGASLGLLQRALQNSRLMHSGTPPFRIDVSFNSSGDAAQTGQGQFYSGLALAPNLALERQSRRRRGCARFHTTRPIRG
jgi:hypothetical protein